MFVISKCNPLNAFRMQFLKAFNFVKKHIQIYFLLKLYLYFVIVGRKQMTQSIALWIRIDLLVCDLDTYFARIETTGSNWKELIKNVLLYHNAYEQKHLITCLNILHLYEIYKFWAFCKNKKNQKKNPFFSKKKKKVLTLFVW